MSLDEFAAMLADFTGDLELMARGHPFTAEEINDAVDAVAVDSREYVVLQVMLRNVR